MPETREPPMMSIEVLRQVQSRLLADGEVLQRGDQFAVLLHLDQPRHVYVLHSRPGATTTPLYPQAASTLVPSALVQRVPADGQYLTIPALEPGDALCVVLSLNRLTAPLPSCSGTNDGRDIETGHKGTEQRPSSNRIVLPLPLAEAPREPTQP